MKLNIPINCNYCGLHKFRDKMVIGKGSIPAQVLFIGEAPGISEDTIGEPFAGLEGKLLDVMINEAFIKSKLTKIPTYYITSTVMCRPTDSQSGSNREPSEIEVLSCRENILEIIDKVNPKGIVLVGKVAEKYYGKIRPVVFNIQHPAYLLRGGGIMHPQYSRNVRVLTHLFKEAIW